MPDPYQILGLPPSAEPAEAEVAFRRLLKDAHPDRHIGAAEPELADAARRTRELTDAISAVRAGWRPPPGPGAWHEQHGFLTSEDADWFGNPIRPTRTGMIECPLCGLPFGVLADYDLHLAECHGTDGRAFSTGRPRSRSHKMLHWLRFLPAPSLTLLGVLVMWWAAVVRVAPPMLERIGIWLGVAGFFILRGMVPHAQRHRL